MSPPRTRRKRPSSSARPSRKRSRGAASSSDLAVSAGRGRNVPRARLGHDTLLGLAQSQRRTLSYAYTGSLSGTGSYSEATTVTLNNPFSPNGGASAAGYAKYMAFYSKAYVMGARIRISAVDSFTAGQGTATGLSITTNNTSLGSTVSAIENGMCDWRFVYGNPDSFTLNESVDVAKFLNKSKILDDGQLFSTSSAGPSQLIVAHFWSQGLGASPVYSLTFVGEIEFDVVFTDPIPFT